MGDSWSGAGSELYRAVASYASGEGHLADMRGSGSHRTNPRDSPMSKTQVEVITSVQRRRRWSSLQSIAEPIRSGIDSSSATASLPYSPDRSS
jgi:hypothetical protein